MLTNVPQYIDVEDKVAGPLTVKQLIWMLILGAVLFVLWMLIPAKSIFIVIALPILALFVAMAFYKPFGQPLPGFIASGFMFLFAPKIYVWKRMPQNKLVQKRASIKQDTLPQMRNEKLTPQQISALAHVLDTEGAARDEEALELIHQRELRNAPKNKQGLFFSQTGAVDAPKIQDQRSAVESPVGGNGENQPVQRRNFGDYLNM